MATGSQTDNQSPPSSPPSTPGRTLVLCFDGTSNQYDGENTNVVRFYSLLQKNDQQVVYYQPGIGTYSNPGILTPLVLWGAKMLDEGIAWYLDAHVMGGYQFLMQNYHVGDRICIFGFSRGAYTARAVAGMLTKIGLLPKDNLEQIPLAYKLYQRTDDDGITQSAGFKQTFCRTVYIDFLGVWDTVASVGVIMGRTLPFTLSNNMIKTFRHALSLDEHRAKFRPTLYHRPSPNETAASHDPEHASPVLLKGTGSSPLGKNKVSTRGNDRRFRLFKRGKDDIEAQSTSDDNTNRDSSSPKAKSVEVKTQDTDSQDTEQMRPDTDVLEVWFAGCHSDVGGGSVADSVQSSLANISLRWMVREVTSSQCGITFDHSALERLNISIAPATGNSKAKQAELDEQDCNEPLHDSLHTLPQSPFWWILEVLPLTYTWQDSDGVWHKEFKWHLGRGRNITDDKPNFHASVKDRMNDKNATPKTKYVPKAKYTIGSEVYVQ